MQYDVEYYEKMIKQATNIDFEPMLAFTQYQLAEYYIWWRRYPEAIDILIQCIVQMKDGRLA
jgi:hypothetical protein